VSTERHPIAIKDPFTAAILAWLVPGLGHIYQGRIAKGVLFFVCLMGTFLWGMYLGEWKVVYWAWDDRKPVVEGLCRLGMAGPSLPSLLQSLPALDSVRRQDRGLPLIGHFQATPSRAKLDELHARLSRSWSIAQVFTMIASLLNILVILDAQGGPAERLYARSEGDEPELEPA
jgi:TM2 domain-containing membrane protein YozV